MFPLFTSMLLLTLCTSTLSRPLAAPAIAHVSRSYSPNDPDLPPAVRSICEGGVNATTVDSSTTFAPGIVLTTGSCTSSNPPADPIESVDAVSPIRPTCPSALNDCQSRFGSMFQGNGYVAKCGAPCDSSCYPGTNGPDPNDCQWIINGFYAQNPQLFTLSASRYVLVTHGSCGIGFQNTIAPSSIGCSQTILYDYADIGAIAQYLAWNCQAAQNARGGRCTARTGTYQLNIPDFYAQVYKN